jgi:hypothetical protein
MAIKILGYVLAIAGLGVIALSNQIAKMPFLASNPKAMLYSSMAGVVLVAVGIGLSFSGSKASTIKHASEEVPIYQGTGKNRKIVGYQKA